MTTSTWQQPSQSIRARRLPARKPVMPSALLGMLVFVGAELMFFLGLISAFIVIKAGVSTWAPPADVTLPVATTAFNTLMLLLSGVALFLSGRTRKTRGADTHLWIRCYEVALGLGAFFVAYQGYEWVQLVRYGMNMTSSIYGACFYLLIGTHALHAFAALLGMAWYYPKVARHEMSAEGLMAIQAFWFLVVGIWPVLYGLVYF